MRRRCKYFGYLRCLNCWFWASRRAICSSVLLIRFVVGFVSKLFVLGAVLPWADLMISIKQYQQEWRRWREETTRHTVMCICFNIIESIHWLMFYSHTMSVKCFTIYLHVCTDIKWIDQQWSNPTIETSRLVLRWGFWTSFRVIFGVKVSILSSSFFFRTS